MTNQSTNSNLSTPQKGTKQAKLVSLLARKSGTTLTAASQTLGWQRHTTSAALTGLRKRGYEIQRTPRPDKEGVYRIAPEANG